MKAKTIGKVLLEMKQYPVARDLDQHIVGVYLGARNYLASAFAYMGVDANLQLRPDTVALFVNGKPHTWVMTIQLAFSDTFTVRLYQVEDEVTLLEMREDVYFDELQDATEQMYDECIKKYNNGMITV